MKTLKDLDLQGKRVLLRVDFNVPIENGVVLDTTRIEAAKPTVEYLLDNGAKQVICVAHLGRPKGEVNEEFRLEPVAKKMNEVLGRDIEYINNIPPLKGGDITSDKKIVLLENIRFFSGEKKNDPEFSKQLAGLADIYVNDAFGTAHRAHASTVGVAELLPHAAGLLMEKEVSTLQKVLDNPEAPVVAIIGGAKISTKIQLIKTLLPKVDDLLLGGALANTVLLAQNHKIGKSLVEEELANTIKDLLDNKLRIPVDVVTDKQVRGVGNVEDDEAILDIGPDTVNIYKKLIAKAKTIIWNGPMGLFEKSEYAEGTFAMAKAVAESDAYSVIGGGETVAAVKKVGVADQISFISTGGGAMLEYMEGKELPGVKALE